MTNALAKQESRAIAPQVARYQTLKSLVESRTAELRSVAAKHASPDRLANIVLSLASRTPALLECTPGSIVGSLVECSRLGLEPTGRIGGAYLIPFKNRKRGADGQWTTVMEAQLITAYQGEIDLACRTGLAQSVEARIVYENDHFEHREGDRPRIIHKPAQDKRGEERLVYARALLPSGAYTFEVLYRDDIEARRNRSRAKDNGPWKSDYWPMAKKSAIRALTNRLPKSAQFYENPLGRAYVAHQTHEEVVEFGLESDSGPLIELGGTVDLPEPEAPQSSTDRLANKLEAKAAVQAARAEAHSSDDAERWEAEQVAKAEAAGLLKGRVPGEEG